MLGESARCVRCLPPADKRYLQYSYSDITPCNFVGHERSKYLAVSFGRALGAGLKALLGAAFAHLTYAGAEISFHTFRPAAHTVDMFRLDDIGVVHLTPQLRSFLAKSVVIVDSGDTGITLLAIQTAVADKFFFHNSEIFGYQVVTIKGAV